MFQNIFGTWEEQVTVSNHHLSIPHVMILSHFPWNSIKNAVSKFKLVNMYRIVTGVIFGKFSRRAEYKAWMTVFTPYSAPLTFAKICIQILFLKS